MAAANSASLAGRLQTAVREYASRVREFSPNARLFLVAATLGGLNAGVASVLLNLYLLSIGHDEAFVGRLISYGQLAALPAALLAGPLIDTWGARRTMLGGTALVGGGALALLVSAAAPVLLLGEALRNMGGLLVYIAVSPFLARQSSPRERAHLFAVTAAAYVASNALGKLLGGHLPGLIRLLSADATLADSYRLALFGGALGSALGVPLLFMVREQPSAAAGERRDQPSGLGVLWSRVRTLMAPLRHLLADRRVSRLVAQFVMADVLIRLGGNLVLPFFNVFFVRHLGATEAWYGTLAFADRALVVVATLLAAPLAARFGPVATVAVTQVLSVPMLLAIGFSPTVALASVALLARGSLMEMTVPVRDSFMMEVIPDSARATANAVLLVAGYAVGAVGARVGGRLLGAEHFGLACLVTGALYVASALLYWRFFSAAPQAAPGHKLDLAALAR